jgi:hypothetical protein
LHAAAPEVVFLNREQKTKRSNICSTLLHQMKVLMNIEQKTKRSIICSKLLLKR